MAVTEVTVEPRARGRRNLPIAIIATTVLSFVAGALTLGAQTRPRPRTTAATTLPDVGAGHAPTSDLTTHANVYELAISGTNNNADSTAKAPAIGRAPGSGLSGHANVYDLAISGASGSTDATLPATAAGPAPTLGVKSDVNVYDLAIKSARSIPGSPPVGPPPGASLPTPLLSVS